LAPKYFSALDTGFFIEVCSSVLRTLFTHAIVSSLLLAATIIGNTLLSIVVVKEVEIRACLAAYLRPVGMLMLLADGKL